MSTEQMKSGDPIIWRGRLGVFVKKSQLKGKVRIRLATNTSIYLVSIHEIRRHKYLKNPFPVIKNDPLQALIKSSH